PITRAMLLVPASKPDASNSFDICCPHPPLVQLGRGSTLFRRNFVAVGEFIHRSNLAPPFNSSGSRKLHLTFTKVIKTRNEDVILCYQPD
ncbi:uncharacterized protein F5147DRAFT_540082, partial [Suillus discolor]